MNHGEHLAARAAIDPQSPALVFEDRVLGYGALDRQAGQVAAWLWGRGVRPGDRVALLLPNCPEFVVAHQATLRVGAIAVTLNPRTRRRALAHMLGDAGARVVFATPDSAAEVPWDELEPRPEAVAAQGSFPGATAFAHLLRGRGREPEPVEADAPAVILYSSGTTGAPKGVVLSHANLEFNSAAKIRYLGIQPEDRLLLFVPLFHVFGQNAILSPALRAGATVLLKRHFHPEQVVAELRRGAVSMCFAVPTVYRLLLDALATAAGDPEAELGGVRMWFSAAATLPPELARRWRERVGAPIHEGYGLSETSPFACFNHLERHRLGSVGTPIAGVEVRVVDPETRAVLPAGERGEVELRGPNVMLGYWQRPRDTAAAVVDGWFRTGDLGRVDAEGYVFLIDRIKDMIDVAGLKVWPAEIEALLVEHPAVELAAVYRRPDPDTGERVAAAVVPEPGAALAPADLQRWCRERLAVYKVPTQIELVDSLPISSSGKILRRVLSEGECASETTRRDDPAPVTSER